MDGRKDLRGKLIEQAMIQSQLNGEAIDRDRIISLPIKQRMIFFARVIEGSLRRLRNSPTSNRRILFQTHFILI